MLRAATVSGLLAIAAGAVLWALASGEVMPALGTGPLGSTGLGTGTAAGPTGAEALAESSAASVRAAVAVAGAAVVRIVDADDRTPLLGASVALRSIGAEAASWQGTADASGCVLLPAALLATCELQAAAPGYVAVAGTVSAAAPPITVALQRGGSVAVAVTDAEGRPAVGVVVVLLPPLQRGEWEQQWHTFATAEPTVAAVRQLRCTDGLWSGVGGAVQAGENDGSDEIDASFLGAWSWRARTDATGSVVWQGLPPHRSYRWAVLPPTHASVLPAHERQRLAPGPQGVTVAAAPPVGLSGTFTVAAGDTTRLTARVVGSSGLRGQLAATSGARPVVTLYRIEQTTGDNGSAVLALTILGERPAAADGSFVFENVAAGQFLVRSRWFASARDLHYASITCALEAGSDLDLGTVLPLAGHDVVVTTGLVDDQGAAVVPGEVLLAADEVVTHLTFSMCPDSMNLAESVADVVPIPLGREVVVHGVPNGRLHLRLTAPGAVAVRPGTVEIHDGPFLEQRVDAQHTVAVALLARSVTEVALSITTETGAAVALETLPLIDRRSGRFDALPVSNDATTGQASMRCAPGDYHAMAAIVNGVEPYWGSVAMSISRSGAPVSLVLRRAAAVAGTLVDLRGEPIAGRVLQWTLPEWIHGSNAVWLITATSDADGRFRLPVVPIGVELVPSASTPPLPVRSRDVESDVVLVGDR